MISDDQDMPKILAMENRMYPEFGAGYYSHKDCTVAFYTRLHALLDKNIVVLNLGAGRGRAALLEPSPYRKKLQLLRGKVKSVIGIDVDPAVVGNPDMDQTHVIDPFGPWPLEDASVDVILSDHVFEHVDNPTEFVREIARVLKPGGWLCARTPAKWGYIGLGARLVPNALHVRLLKNLQPHRKAEDVFPVVYKLNTIPALRRSFPDSVWKNCTYGHNGVPGYHANNVVIFRMIQLWCWLMPNSLAAKYHIFIQKRA
jgi:SAM-dependent methyltransferase